MAESKIETSSSGVFEKHKKISIHAGRDGGFGYAHRKRAHESVKYQIFISSTFSDLAEERQAVHRAILDLHHIPAGMEVFPAFDQSQLEFIKRVIDDCDYYVVIVGGRYGSLTEDGVSFTEAEYDYAVEKNVPVIALIHEDPGEIASGKVESDTEAKARLNRFKQKLSEGRLVKFWRTKDDLSAKVIISLTASFNELPQIGWTRANSGPSDEALEELASLRRRERHNRESYIELHRKLSKYEDFEDSEIEVRFVGTNGPTEARLESRDLVKVLAAPLARGATRTEIEQSLLLVLRHRIDEKTSELAEGTVDTALLYLEVFEIAEETSDGTWKILEDQKHLLRAAFRKSTPPSSVPRNLDDEIPF